MKRAASLGALAALSALALGLGGCFQAISPSPKPYISSQVIPHTYSVLFVIKDAPPLDSVDWYFGDGTKAEGAESSIQHDYTAPGTYDVTAILHLGEGSSEPGPPGPGPGPSSLLLPMEDASPLTVTTRITIPPIVPIEITGITVEVVDPPYWWSPGGEDHYPEGVPLRFTCQWKDWVPGDNIAPVRWHWWAIRIKSGDVYQEGDGEQWVSPGLMAGGSCGYYDVEPYDIRVAMYCSDGRTLVADKEIYIEHALPH